jgi:hypothetical protein
VAKTAVITIQLVPESKNVDDAILKKEIINSLRCDWLLDIINMEIAEFKNQSKK